MTLVKCSKLRIVRLIAEVDVHFSVIDVVDAPSVKGILARIHQVLVSMCGCCVDNNPIIRPLLLGISDFTVPHFYVTHCILQYLLYLPSHIVKNLSKHR